MRRTCMFIETMNYLPYPSPLFPIIPLTLFKSELYNPVSQKKNGLD